MFDLEKELFLKNSKKRKLEFWISKKDMSNKKGKRKKYLKFEGKKKRKTDFGFLLFIADFHFFLMLLNSSS